MKYLIIILSLMISDNGCANSTPKLNVQESGITFEYSALSRGYFKKIIIDQKDIIVFKDRNEDEPISKVCSKEDWDKLLSSYSSVEAEKIAALKAPTDKRLYDGAAIATLKISINGKTYTSCSFDHGFPPKEIEALINEILSVSESHE